MGKNSPDLMQVKLSPEWRITWHSFYDEPPVASEMDLLLAVVEIREGAKTTKLALDIDWLRTRYRVVVAADCDWDQPRREADCKTREEARDIAERWSFELLKLKR